MSVGDVVGLSIPCICNRCRPLVLILPPERTIDHFFPGPILGKMARYSALLGRRIESDLPSRRYSPARDRQLGGGLRQVHLPRRELPAKGKRQDVPLGNSVSLYRSIEMNVRRRPKPNASMNESKESTTEPAREPGAFQLKNRPANSIQRPPISV